MTPAATLDAARVGRDGALTLRFEQRGAATVVAGCRYTLPLQVLAPVALDDPAAIVSILNPTGGLVGGDRLSIDVHAAADRRAEHRRVMGHRPAVLDREGQTGEERIVRDADRDPERLPAHLTAGRPELRHRLHRVESRVECQPSRGVVSTRELDGDGDRASIGRSGRALEMRRDERLEAPPVAHAPVLHVGLEPERLGEPAGGKESVRELQQREQRRITGHDAGPGRSARTERGSARIGRSSV